MLVATAFWRRLDTAGHDACRLFQTDSGWHLDGATTFLHTSTPAHLTYSVHSTPTWVTQKGHVCGWIGAHPIDFHIERQTDGTWMLNEKDVPGLEQCFDLDLGFTPATNLLQLRRLSLAEGQAANVPVAWIDVTTSHLNMLHQRYERRTEWMYWYESPQFNYQALLEVAPTGFITRYPELWEAEV